MSIIINRYQYPNFELYNAQDKLVSVILNDNELNQVRIQLLQQELEGYYLKRLDNDNVIHIDEFGNLSDWSIQMETTDQLIAIIKLQCKLRINKKQEKILK